MKSLRYIENIVTLTLNEEKCTGCGLCETVCPHRVFGKNGDKMKIIDKNGCMECGACARNCPVSAVSVSPGVGCAGYIISGWIHGKENASCGGNMDCC
jgi:ferredoxin